jgi:hypothetical protein
VFFIINNLRIEYSFFYATRVVNIVLFSALLDWGLWLISLVVFMSTFILWVTKAGLPLPAKLSLLYLLLAVSFTLIFLNTNLAMIVLAPLGLVVVTFSIYYGNGFQRMRRGEAFCLIGLSIIGVIVCIEVAALISWSLNATDSGEAFGSGAQWIFPRLDLQLFNILYPLTSWLLLLFLFNWIWIPIIKYVRIKYLPRFTSKIPIVNTIVQERETQRIFTCFSLNQLNRWMQLLILCVIASVVGYYPYFSLSPPTFVGVDSTMYFEILSRMIQEGPFIFGGLRPFFLLFLYVFQTLTQLSAVVVIRILPAVLTIGFSLVSFGIIKICLKDSSLAVLVSILSIFSIQTVAGVYSYILSQWFALIELVLFFTAMVYALQQSAFRYSLLASGLAIITLLTHPSWLTIIGVLVTYTIVSLRKSEGRRHILIALTPLITIIAAFVPFIVIRGIADPTFWTYLDVIILNLDLSQILISLQPAISRMIQYWVGGGFGNPWIIALAIIGMIELSTSKNHLSRILRSWILFTSLAFLILVPGSEDLYWRLAYIIPFHIPAAIGVHRLFTEIHGVFQRRSWNLTYFRWFQGLSLALLILLLSNYTLRSLDIAMIQPA